MTEVDYLFEILSFFERYPNLNYFSRKILKLNLKSRKNSQVWRLQSKDKAQSFIF